MLGWAIFLFVKKRLKVIICGLSLPFSSVGEFCRSFCVFLLFYFVSCWQGKEELDSLCEELVELGLCSKSFEDLPRVVVRWLGRLLPQNGWVLI